MRGRLGEWWRRLTDKDGGKGPRWLLGLGLVGILLIAVSELFPAGDGKTSPAGETATVTAQAAEQALEERIRRLLSAVEGVGSCQVMVTLERDAQTVYAADTLEGGEQVLVVETEAGPVGLPLTTLLPSVKGVAVVCDGGGNPAVCQRVTELVATAFHISQRRVYVAPQK